LQCYKPLDTATRAWMLNKLKWEIWQVKHMDICYTNKGNEKWLCACFRNAQEWSTFRWVQNTLPHTVTSHGPQHNQNPLYLPVWHHPVSCNTTWTDPNSDMSTCTRRKCCTKQGKLHTRKHCFNWNTPKATLRLQCCTWQRHANAAALRVAMLQTTGHCDTCLETKQAQMGDLTSETHGHMLHKQRQWKRRMRWALQCWQHMKQCALNIHLLQPHEQNKHK